MTDNTSPLLVAVDDGYAQTKLVGETAVGEKTSLRFRSSVRSGRHGVASLSGDGSIGCYVTAEGEHFTVSDSVGAENTTFDGFHFSPMNRVLVHHALTEAGYGGQRVKLCASLPVADYFSGSKRNAEKVASKVENLGKGVHSVVPGAGPAAEVAEVVIGCQAVCAFVDYAMNDDGSSRDVPVERVAVVDIGGRTTDIALILDGNAFDPSRSGTDNIGVLDVYKDLAERIRQEYRTTDTYPTGILDKAVRTGSIKLWGRPMDVSALVRSAVLEQQGKLARQVELRLGSASDVDAVLFVGGGAALFPTVSEAFRNAHVAAEPEFANARGLFKYANAFWR